MYKNLILFLIIISTLGVEMASAACGANTRQWEADAGSDNWNTNNNWNAANRPNSAGENALIVSDWFFPRYPNSTYTLGCIDIQSGKLTVTRNRTVTLTGDYFRNPNTNSLVIGGNTWEVYMNGTAVQEFLNVDPIARLRIGNGTTVNLKEEFNITNRFLIDAGAGNINIEDSVTIDSTASDVTIPSSATVTVQSGAIFRVLRNLTVNGVLKVEAGGLLEIGNGSTLTVAAGGLIQLAGSPGNVAKVDANDAGSFTFNVAGDFNAEYFSINRTSAAGLNVTGNIQKLDNGDFHFIATNGYAMTLGAAATIPSTSSSVGFFEEGGTGTQRNVNATSFNVSNLSFSNWSGIGDTANETDPNGRISWGTEATPKLQIVDRAAVGEPPSTIGVSSADTQFITIGFSMTGSATSSSYIDTILFTIGGVNNAADISALKVYKDVNSNCTYNAGTDTQIGSDLVPIGSPAEATLTLGATDVVVQDTTEKCIFVFLATSASAQDGSTLAVSIAKTDDITNSENYDWSTSGGPPLVGGFAEINGSNTRVWAGGYGNPTTGGNFAQNNQWLPAGFPNSTLDCQIGEGYSFPFFADTTERSCLNASLPANGRMSWQNRTTTWSVYGSLTIGNNYTFTQAASGTLAFKGVGNQSISAETDFPGNLNIANTGGSVWLNNDWVVSGNLTVNSGDFVVTTGNTLSIGGSVTVNGGRLIIEPGATLEVADNSTVTVGASGEIRVLGTSGQTANIRTASTAEDWNMVVNGTIAAQYYSFSNLNTTGVTINSGASIDATYYLQNGTFSYPVNNTTTFLTLNRQIPGNALNNVTFDSGGSPRTGITNITTSAAAGTLNITDWNGDWGGESFDSDPTYNVTWGTQTNTIDVTQDATTSGGMDQGSTYVIGRFAFKQTQAGAFNDTDITELAFTLYGTGDGADVAQLKAYYETDCNSAGGTLLGTATFSGVPAKATISNITGATISAHATAPPTACVYVELDIASLATADETIGIKIDSNNDVINSEGYSYNGAASPPVDLGTARAIVGSTTVWTGGASTAWNNGGNWNGGVPNSTLNCIINDAANDPSIAGVTANCKSLTIGNGTLSMSGGATLNLYGGFTNTGTFNQNGQTFNMVDDGVNPTTQTIDTTSAIETLGFNKTAGGSIVIGSGTLEITNTLNFGASNSFEFNVQDGKTLKLNGGATVSSATLKIEGGGTTQVASGQTMTVSGGTLNMDGVAEAMPNTEAASYYSNFSSKKAKMEAISGSFGFSATSGSVGLDGFVFDGLDTNGLSIGGTAVLSNMDGGQFAGLSTSYGSVKVLNINTTGSIPAAATKIGINWETSAGTEGNTPANTENYQLAASTGCGSQTMDITEWYGDWYDEVTTFDTSTKVSTASCNINFNGSVSAVSLLSYTATPYNAAVDLEWETIFEQDHSGFNVFRAGEDGENFLQINPELIRNNLSSVSYKGKYRFVDNDVENGETYQYYIQDIDKFGNTELHGPRTVTPLATYGAVPAAGGGVNDGGSNDDDGEADVTDPGSIANPSFKDLGDGVQILSQTSTHLRIKITPPTANFSASSWNGSYEQVSMSSYAKTQEAGKPELLKRNLLVEVYPFATSATLQNNTQTQSAIGPKAMQPAPDYVLNGSNILEPVYAIDSSFYNVSQLRPANFVTVDTDLLSVSGKKFIKISIDPLSYNPVTSDLNRLDSAIIDIAIDGNSWEVDPPADATDYNANIVANTLRIDFTSKGMIEVLYDDIVSSNNEAPFENADTSELRLYNGNTEIPLYLVDGDGVFNSGDKLYFYGDYVEAKDDLKNQRVLSTQNIYGVAAAPLRFSTIDGSATTGRVGANPYSSYTVVADQNNDILMYENLGDDQDHFIWKVLRATGGYDTLSMSIELPYLNSAYTDDVNLSLTLKGKELGWNETEYDHHVGVFINGSGTANKTFTFSTKEIQTLDFTLPHSLFTAGTNTVVVKALGTYASAVSVLETVAIDKLSLTYFGAKGSTSDRVEFTNDDPNTLVTMEGFSGPAIELWDISDLTQPGFVTNGSVYSTDGNTTYKMDFEANDNSAELGTKYYGVLVGSYLKPSGLSLSSGFQLPLKSSSNKADLLIVGHKSLTDKTSELVSQREGQGLTTKVITLDQIYAEFSNGLVSAKAIRDFVSYTQSNWSAPYPKYLLLLGDGSFDPKKNLSSTTKETGDIPMTLEGARFFDYATDNYFVSTTSSYLPQLAVGRIPTNDPAKIESYISKMLLYENGTTSPSEGLMELSFISGEENGAGDVTDPNEDKFDERISELTSLSSRFTNDTLHWHTLGGNAPTKTAVIDRFTNSTPFMMTYMGHGAPNQWGSLSFMVNDDMDSLNNSKLPVVMSLNCDNAQFYDPERTNLTRSMGEALILNENGGAISFIGSSTQTTPAAQTYFAKAFYSKVIEETNKVYHRVTLGEILQETKITLGTDNYSKDITRSTMLFGDPSMPIPAALFAPAPPPVDSNPVAGGGGGGCSAAASGTDGSNGPSWPEGILEFLMLFALGWGLRRLQKRYLA
ncbi:MAG: hypothetical protein ACJAT2_003127 [Bacteriovoracaceae bacterium]